MAEKDLKVDQTQVRKGIEALCDYAKKFNKKDILAEDESVYLQLGFKKVAGEMQKTVKVRLPHSTIDGVKDVCLFVKDLDPKSKDTEKTKDHYLNLLEEQGVEGIAEIIPMKLLKLEYKPHEARRNLSNMYGGFLADERIVRFLPGLLGKHFYGRRKIPATVKMTSKDLKREVDKALNVSPCVISGRGPSSTMVIGETGMPVDSLLGNTIAAAMKLAQEIPGGAPNIKSLHVKTSKSVAIPIYMSAEGVDEVVMPEPEASPPEDEPEDVTTVTSGLVRVTREGYVHIVNEKAEAGRQKRRENFVRKKEAFEKARKEAARVRLGKKRTQKEEDVKQEVDIKTESESEDCVNTPKRSRLSTQDLSTKVKEESDEEKPDKELLKKTLKKQKTKKPSKATKNPKLAKGKGLKAPKKQPKAKKLGKK